jgi:hypothetical protein
MKKVHLDVDTLQVESFDVVSAAAEKDGVHGYGVETNEPCSSHVERTCYVTCSDFWVCELPPE